MLEQRRVLSTNMAPAFDLTGIGTEAAPLVFELAPSGDPAATLDIDFLTDARVTLVDSETPNDRIRFQRDPDLNIDFPEDASVTAGGDFAWTPDDSDIGVHKVRVIAWDRGAMPRASASEFFVQIVDPNNAPVLETIAGIAVDPPAGEPDPTFLFRVEEGLELRITAAATDPDAGDTVTYSLEGASPGNPITIANPPSIDPVTGLITWAPTDIPGTGDYDFTVVATDDGVPNLSDTETITITVIEANTEPDLSLTVEGTPATSGDTSVNVSAGNTLSVLLTATDANGGDDLMFFVDAASEALGVTVTPEESDPRQATLSWPTEVADIAGSPYEIQVYVADNGGASENGLETRPLADFSTLTVTVELGPAPPVIESITSGATELPVIGDPGSEIFQIQVTEDDELNLTINATDPNGDPIEYTLFEPTLNGNPAPTLGLTTGAFSWTPTTQGTYLFAVTAEDPSDSSFSDTVGLEVTVLEAPREPVLQPIADVTVGPAGPELVIPLVGSDENLGDLLTYTPTYSPEITSGNDPVITVNADRTATFTWTPVAADFAGSDSIDVTITLSDGVAETSDVMQTFTVTLDDVGPRVVMAPSGMQPSGLAVLDVVFDEPVSLASLPDDLVSLILGDGTNTPVAIDQVSLLNETTLRITPSNPPLPDQSYVLTVVSGGIEDEFGNTLVVMNPVSGVAFFAFTVGA